MSRSRRLFWCLAVVFAVLAGTTEERMASGTTDDELMLETSVSLAEFGEAGILRESTFLVPLPRGDAYAPYGLGFPLLQAGPARLARGVEGLLGRGSSQSVFSLFQALLVLLAA